MQRTILWLWVILALITNSPSSAQVTLDVSKITCWQFATYKITNPQYISIWVSGYYHGKAGDTMIDPPTVVANATKMQEYCTRIPTFPSCKRSRRS